MRSAELPAVAPRLALTLGVADALELVDVLARQPYGLFDHLHDPILVVLCSIPRLEPFAWRGDVGMPYIAEDVYASIWTVLDDSATELVGRSFKTERVDGL